ncbi:MAG: alpha/beta fold hydrolase [Parasporobacterium sp.]|nr:alpha/beta fold hydrolase [Parasporobacterium sp.]
MNIKAKSIAALVIILVLVTGCMPAWARNKTKEKSVELNFRSEEFHVMNGDVDLYGELYLPVEEKDEYPLIILSHGLGSNANAVGHHAKYFATNGIAAYIFDVNHGGPGSRSGDADSDMTELSPLTVTSDLSAVLEYFETLPFIDTDNIFLGGVSMGGFMSAFVSAQHPDEVKAIVLQSPGFSLSEQYKGIDPEELPETEEVRGMVLGKVFALDSQTFDIYEMIANYKNDVLILHGDIDDIVDISYAYRAAEVYENATLSVYEGVDHSFAGSAKLDSEKEELEFLLAHIAERKDSP